MENKPKYQFSLATFLWIVFAIACFFAGKHFDALAEVAISPQNQNYKTVKISVGNSTTINTVARIPEIVIDDPSVCGIKPTSPTSFDIVAKKTGLAKVTFIDPMGGKTYYQVEVSN